MGKLVSIHEEWNMSAKKSKMAAMATAATAALAVESRAAQAAAVDDLIAKIRDKNDTVRAEAMFGAGKVGAPAVKPLADVVATDKDFEIARAARRAMWQIARYVGRPGAGDEKKATVAELMPLVADSRPVAVRREVLWMLSELAGDEAVEPVAAILKDKELREDARMVLQRLPGEKSLAALKAGLAAAPDDFKINIAESLRARGVEVPGLPDEKRKPTRQTNMKPLDEKQLEEAVKSSKGKGKKR